MMLKTRLLTALWGIPLVIAAIWFDEPLPWFSVFAVILGLLAIYEFFKMTGVLRFVPLATFGIIWTAALIAIPHCTYELSLLVWLASGVVLGAFAFALQVQLLLLVEPVLNPVWAWLVHGEQPGPWALLGGLVIITATGVKTVADRGSE